MSKAEKDRMNRVASLNCIVCAIYYGIESPAEIHHLTGSKYRSTGKKSEHYIPLCPQHHRYGSNEHPSIHGHPAEFNKRFGSQEFLLNNTNKLLLENKNETSNNIGSNNLDSVMHGVFIRIC